MQCYIEVAGDLGLTVVILKTKIMACGRLVQPGDEGPIRIDDNNCVESVSEFQYLGSMVERSGRMDTDVERRVMQEASRAFGCLRRAVFKDRDLTVRTKRNVYQTCVLSVSLYGRKLDAFHHWCIRTILGIMKR